MSQKLKSAAAPLVARLMLVNLGANSRDGNVLPAERDTQGLRPLDKVAVASLLAVAVYFGARSALLAFDLHRSLAYSDQWVFVGSYFGYLDGNFRWPDLLAFHNEHRIGTGRIILFADAILFNMKGWLPLVMQYASLAGIAAILARLATDKQSHFFIGAVAGLGLLWSPSQYENLSWALQTIFPFVHLFAIAALGAFAYSLTGLRPVIWLMAACAFDFLAINSLASGILTVVPAICISVWLRRIDWRIVVFSAAHIAMVAWFFYDYRSGAVHIMPSVALGLWMVIEFLGTPFRGYPASVIATCGLVGLLASVAALTWSALVRRKEADPRSAVLLSIAVFVLGEAIMASLARVEAGISARYCTPALVFCGALIGFYYRQCSLLPHRMIVPARGAVAVTAALAIISVNSKVWIAAWKDKAVRLDRATPALVHGDYKIEPGVVWSGAKPDVINRYISLKMGPFAR
jgi:hypothetical protein